MAGNKIRYSVTLLSYQNKDIAVNDELMLDKNNGSLYYKRSDGKIIRCTSAGGGNGGTSLYQEIIDSGFELDKIFFEDPATGLFVLTEQTLEDQPRVSDTDTQMDNTFFVHRSSGAYFIDVETRSTDKMILELLTYLRNEDPDETPNVYNAVVTYTITGQMTDVDVEGSSNTYTANITLNKPSPIRIPDEYINNDNYDLLKISIDSVRSTVMKYYDPDTQSTMNLFKSVIPDDKDICYAKIDLAYFTKSTDTVFVDELNVVLSITDSQSAIEEFTTKNLKSYVRGTLEPLIVRLYNAGLSTASSYVKSFETSDWVLSGSSLMYEIEIPKAEHLLTGEIVAHVYYYEDGLYKSDYGVWDIINYKISCNPNDKTIKLTTESPFKGKIVIMDNSKFGDIAYITTTGNVQVSTGVMSVYKQID